MYVKKCSKSYFIFLNYQIKIKIIYLEKLKLQTKKKYKKTSAKNSQPISFFVKM